MYDASTQKLIDLMTKNIETFDKVLQTEIFPLLPKTNKRQKEMLKQKLYAYTTLVATETIKAGWNGGYEEGLNESKVSNRS